MHWILRKCLKNAFQIVSRPCIVPHSQLPLSYCRDSYTFTLREVLLLSL